MAADGCQNPSLEYVKVQGPVILTITVASFVIGVSFFLLRRRFSPIKDRLQRQIILTVGSILGLTTLWVVVNYFPSVFTSSNCFAVLTMAVLLASVTSSSMLYRMLHSHLQHSKELKKLEFASARNLEHESARKISKMAKLSKSLWALGAVSTAYSLIVLFAVCASSLPGFDAPLAKDSQSFAAGFNPACWRALGQTIVYGIVPVKSCSVAYGFWSMFKLRHVKDNFHIKEEILVTFVAYMMCIIYAIIVNIQGSDCHALNLRPDLGVLIFLFLPSIAVSIHSFGINVGRSFWSKKYTGEIEDKTTMSASTTSSSPRMAVGIANSNAEFRKLLEFEEGFQMFQKFLEQEWSVENILFWKVAVHFRTKFESSESDDTVAMFKDIYERYIAENAPLCVNLPYQMRQKLSQIMEEGRGGGGGGEETSSVNPKLASMITSDVLRDAEEEIFNLMMKDPFRRFRLGSNPAVKELLAHLNQQQ